MRTLKRIELNMGEIRRTELVDYFLEIGKESADFHRFTGQGWEVEEKFRLRFLRAGG